MNDLGTKPAVCPRWVHWLGVLTVLAACPLLLLGAEVTTKKAGMVDPQGFRTPWHLWTAPLWERGDFILYLIEHGHRLFGFLVGFCIILLTVSLWRKEPRRWVRWLGVAALVGVSIQGLLGGFRVQLNLWIGPQLALIHGCFAQVVFSLLVCLALATSRSWNRSWPSTATAAAVASLRKWSLFAVGLIYFQIILGALVRHTDYHWGPRLHLLLAFGVVATLVWLIRLVLDQHRTQKPLTGVVKVLGGLLVLQVVLGLEAWLTKFRASRVYPQLQPLSKPATNIPDTPWEGLFQAVFYHPDFPRSLHFLVGALVLAMTVSLCLYAYRGLAGTAESRSSLVRPLEGAA